MTNLEKCDILFPQQDNNYDCLSFSMSVPNMAAFFDNKYYQIHRPYTSHLVQTAGYPQYDEFLEERINSTSGSIPIAGSLNKELDLNLVRNANERVLFFAFQGGRNINYNHVAVDRESLSNRMGLRWDPNMMKVARGIIFIISEGQGHFVSITVSFETNRLYTYDSLRSTIDFGRTNYIEFIMRVINYYRQENYTLSDNITRYVAISGRSTIMLQNNKEAFARENDFDIIEFIDQPQNAEANYMMLTIQRSYTDVSYKYAVIDQLTLDHFRAASPNCINRRIGNSYQYYIINKLNEGMNPVGDTAANPEEFAEIDEVETLNEDLSYITQTVIEQASSESGNDGEFIDNVNFASNNEVEKGRIAKLSKSLLVNLSKHTKGVQKIVCPSLRDAKDSYLLEYGIALIIALRTSDKPDLSKKISRKCILIHKEETNYEYPSAELLEGFKDKDRKLVVLEDIYISFIEFSSKEREMTSVHSIVISDKFAWKKVFHVILAYTENGARQLWVRCDQNYYVIMSDIVQAIAIGSDSIHLIKNDDELFMEEMDSTFADEIHPSHFIEGPKKLNISDRPVITSCNLLIFSNKNVFTENEISKIFNSESIVGRETTEELFLRVRDQLATNKYYSEGIFIRKEDKDQWDKRSNELSETESLVKMSSDYRKGRDPNTLLDIIRELRHNEFARIYNQIVETERKPDGFEQLGQRHIGQVLVPLLSNLMIDRAQVYIDARRELGKDWDIKSFDGYFLSKTKIFATEYTTCQTNRSVGRKFDEKHTKWYEYVNKLNKIIDKKTDRIIYQTFVYVAESNRVYYSKTNFITVPMPLVDRYNIIIKDLLNEISWSADKLDETPMKGDFADVMLAGFKKDYHENFKLNTGREWYLSKDENYHKERKDAMNRFIQSIELDSAIIEKDNIDLKPKKQSVDEIKEAVKSVIKKINYGNKDRASKASEIGYVLDETKIKPTLYFHEYNSTYQIPSNIRLSLLEGSSDCEFMNNLFSFVSYVSSTNPDGLKTGHLSFVNTFATIFKSFNNIDRHDFANRTVFEKNANKGKINRKDFKIFKRGILKYKFSEKKDSTAYEFSLKGCMGIDKQKKKDKQNSETVFKSGDLDDFFHIGMTKSNQIEAKELMSYLSETSQYFQEIPELTDKVECCTETTSKKYEFNANLNETMINSIKDTKAMTLLQRSTKIFTSISFMSTTKLKRDIYSFSSAGYNNFCIIMGNGRSTQYARGSKPFLLTYVVDEEEYAKLTQRAFIKHKSFAIEGTTKILVITNWMRFTTDQIVQKMDAQYKVLGSMFNTALLAKMNRDAIRANFFFRAMIAHNARSSLCSMTKEYQHTMIGAIANLSRVADHIREKCYLVPRSLGEIITLDILLNGTISLAEQRESNRNIFEEGTEIDRDVLDPEAGSDMFTGINIDIVSPITGIRMHNFEQFLEDMYVMHVTFRESTEQFHSIISTMNGVCASEIFYQNIKETKKFLLGEINYDDIEEYERQLKRIYSVKSKFVMDDYAINKGTCRFFKDHVKGREEEFRRLIKSKTSINKSITTVISTKASKPKTKLSDINKDQINAALNRPSKGKKSNRETKGKNKSNSDREADKIGGKILPNQKVMDSVMEALEEYKVSDLTIREFLILEFKEIKTVKDLRHLYTVGLRQQFGPDREIYITTLLSKICLKILEDTYAAVGECIPEEFISKGGAKKSRDLEDQNTKADRLLSDLRKTRKHAIKLYSNMDRSKWSLQSLIRVYRIVHSWFVELMDEELWEFIDIVLISMEEKYIQFNDQMMSSIAEGVKKGIPSAIAMDKLMKMINDEEKAMKIESGWFQGMLNYISSVVHCVTVSLGQEYMEEYVETLKDEDNPVFQRISCRHSDDANDIIIATSPRLAKLFILIDRIACLAFCIKDSYRKSNAVDILREFISEYFAMGNSYYPKIKLNTVMGKALTAMGLANDYAEGISRITNVQDKGGCENQCMYLLRLVWKAMEETYQLKEGKCNNPQKILNVSSMYEVPYELGGRPLLDFAAVRLVGIGYNAFRISTEGSMNARMMINMLVKWGAIIENYALGDSSHSYEPDDIGSIRNVALVAPKFKVKYQSRISNMRKRFNISREKDNDIDIMLSDPVALLVKPRKGHLAKTYLKSNYYKKSYLIAYSSQSIGLAFMKLASIVSGKCIAMHVDMSIREYLEFLMNFKRELTKYDRAALCESSRDMLSRGSNLMAVVDDIIKINGRIDLKSKFCVYRTVAVPLKQYELQLSNSVELVTIFLKDKEAERKIADYGIEVDYPQLILDDIEKVVKYFTMDKLNDMDFAYTYVLLNLVTYRQSLIRAPFVRKSDGIIKFMDKMKRFTFLEGMELITSKIDQPHVVNVFSGEEMTSKDRNQNFLDYICTLYNCFVKSLYDAGETNTLVALENHKRSRIFENLIAAFRENGQSLSRSIMNIFRNERLYCISAFINYLGINEISLNYILDDDTKMSWEYTQPQKKARKRNPKTKEDYTLWYGDGQVNISVGRYSLIVRVYRDIESEEVTRRDLLLRIPENEQVVNQHILIMMIEKGLQQLEGWSRRDGRLVSRLGRNLLEDNRLTDFDYQGYDRDLLYLNFLTNETTAHHANCYRSIRVQRIQSLFRKPPTRLTTRLERKDMRSLSGGRYDYVYYFLTSNKRHISAGFVEYQCESILNIPEFRTQFGTNYSLLSAYDKFRSQEQISSIFGYTADTNNITEEMFRNQSENTASKDNIRNALKRFCELYEDIELRRIQGGINPSEFQTSSNATMRRFKRLMEEDQKLLTEGKGKRLRRVLNESNKYIRADTMIDQNIESEKPQSLREVNMDPLFETEMDQHNPHLNRVAQEYHDKLTRDNIENAESVINRDLGLEFMRAVIIENHSMDCRLEYDLALVLELLRGFILLSPDRVWVPNEDYIDRVVHDAFIVRFLLVIEYDLGQLIQSDKDSIQRAIDRSIKVGVSSSLGKTRLNVGLLKKIMSDFPIPALARLRSPKSVNLEKPRI